MRRLMPALLAGLVAGCASHSYTEADFNRPSYDECVSGNCRNGVGTLRSPDGTEMTGAWVNGKRVAGTYQIRWACQPDRTLPLTYDAADRPISGTMIRACPPDALAPSKPPKIASFTGTFGAVHNPFTREVVSTYRSGTYTDLHGTSWEGEFDYIPVRDTANFVGYGKTFLRSGAFVFVGARVDPARDEVVRGLFISEPTRPGQDIMFFRATPDYLEKLRATFVKHRAANEAELAREKQESREAFSTLLDIAAGAAIVYGTARVAAKADRATLESMTSLIRGEPAPAASGSPSRQRPSTVAGSARMPIPVAEFRRLQNAESHGASQGGSSNAAASPGRSTTSPTRSATSPAGLATSSAGPVQQAPVVVANTASNPGNSAAPAQSPPREKRSYPGLPRVLTWKWDSSVVGKNNADAWCPKWTAHIRNDLARSENELISMGPCSCEKDSTSAANKMPGAFEPEYYCKFDYTWRQNVPDYSAR